MSNISISTTFKRVVFSLVAAFLAALIVTYLIGLFASDGTAKGVSFGIGTGTLILAYYKFPDWFKGKE